MNIVGNILARHLSDRPQKNGTDHPNMQQYMLLPGYDDKLEGQSLSDRSTTHHEKVADSVTTQNEVQQKSNRLKAIKTKLFGKVKAKDEQAKNYISGNIAALTNKLQVENNTNEQDREYRLLHSSLDEQSTKQDHLGILLNKFINNVGSEKSTALEDVKQYIEFKKNELCKLTPAINTMLQLVDNDKCGEVMEISHALETLKDTSLLEPTYDKLFEMHHAITILSKLNNDHEFRNKLFLTLPIPKNKTREIFIQLIIKSFLFHNKKENLINSSVFFEKIYSYLSEPSETSNNTVISLYRFIFFGEINKQRILENITSGVELQSFLSIYIDYLNREGITKKACNLSKKLESLDPENQLCQSNIEQANQLVSGIEFLNDLEENLKRNIRHEQSEGVNILTKEMIKDHTKLLNDYIHIIDRVYANYDDHSSEIEKAFQVQDEIMYKISSSIDSVSQVIGHDEIKHSDSFISNDSIHISDIREHNFSNAEVILEANHKKVFHYFLNGGVTKSKCIDLLSSIVSYQISLSVAKNDEDFLANISLKEIKKIQNNLINEKQKINKEIQSKNKNWIRKIFRKKKFNREININKTAIENISKTQNYLDVIYNVMFTKTSFKSTLDSLLNHLEIFESNQKQNPIADSVQQIKALCTKLLTNIDHSNPSIAEEDKGVLGVESIIDVNNMIDEKDIASKINKGKNRIKTAKECIKKTKAILDISSYLTGDDSYKDNIKKVNTALANYNKSILDYQAGKVSDVHVLTIAINAYIEAKLLSNNIVKDNVAFNGKKTTALSIEALRKLLNMVECRRDFIGKSIVLAKIFSENELENRLIKDFSIQDESVFDDNKNHIKEILKLKNDNQNAIINYLKAIENDFNAYIEDELKGNNDRVNNELNSPEENEMITNEKINRYLMDIEKSFLGNYFDVDLDNKLISLKSIKLPEHEREKVITKLKEKKPGKLIPENFQEAYIKNIEIIEFFDDNPEDFYNAELFIEKLKKEINHQSSLQDKMTSYLLHAPETWPDIFCYKGSKKYSNVTIKSPKFGNYLSSKIVEFQKKLFLQLCGAALPMIDINSLRSRYEERVNRIKDKHKNERVDYIKELNTIKDKIEKDFLVTGKSKKIAIINNAIAEIERISIEDKEFTSLIKNKLDNAFNAFNKTLPWYSLTDSKYNFELATLCDKGYTAPRSR
ncbi:MAG: hypothetical protein PUP46_05345 [Endozoicomonas sp. (ex Botrylloides leachii)]|nr:hypothetical protein [Endozoicomonas sp. (ex Botrylloides leachii)]